MPKYRMIHVDHYMCKPVAPFDDLRSEVNPNKPTFKVPVLRVFGADSNGCKICIHVHGFYPYLAIQNREPQNSEISHKIINDIERSIASDNALYQQQQQQQNRNHPGQAQQQKPPDNRAIDPRPQLDTGEEPQQIGEDEAALRQRILNERSTKVARFGAEQKSPIHRIESLKAHNYYGYHHEKEDFLKLHLYDPRMIKPLAQIFEDGKVLNRFVPVFWAHLPYVLLFFIDNNLRGMQFIEIDKMYWRKGRSPAAKSGATNYDSATIVSHEVAPGQGNDEEHQDETDIATTEILPTSSCEFEADVRYEWILNRLKFQSRGNDDALRELWLDDQEASQGSSMIDQKLPLFQLESDYIRQLCDTYNVECKSLHVDPKWNWIDEAPTSERPKPIFLNTTVDTTVSESSYSHHLQDIEDDLEFDDFPLESFPLVAPSKESSDANRAQPPASNPSTSTKCKVGNNEQEASWKDPCLPGSVSQHSKTSCKEMVNHEYQYLCLMSMELHVTTRGHLRPDPAFDPIEAVFYCVRNDVREDSKRPQQIVGMILTDLSRLLPDSPPDCSASSNPRSSTRKIRSLLHKTGLSLRDIEAHVVESEMELIMTIVDIVKAHDPEILIGYEMEQLSWGYVLERANFLNINVSTPLSRVNDNKLGNNSKSVQSDFVQPVIFTGRMVFSTWRIIRHEINLNTCSYERIHHHALNERVPCYSYETLTNWFNQNRNRWRVIDFYLIRVVGQMRILDKFDLIAKVSELARVYGTQFIDVITRGSQIGIESMMLRLAKLQELTPLSPTVMQRNKMKAPEALPLVMEPETNIYYDPIAVLDFQSLYPSVVIAYNYCYSTCLGRVIDLERKERHQFGASHLQIDESEMKRLLSTNSVHVSPCGVAYVKKNIRHGILPRMLSELILTRAMVKDQMKKNMKSEKPNRRLQRILDHRQHGLKMMANTTYGYAGASYTGRMPCVEIADSIVSKGRETLENAIELVESRPEWGAKVVYGDTDSMFIQFKDCSREEAFRRSYEMVQAITAANPYPIKMKFEKIYQPCVLQTKKRYCGFKYESQDQTKPEFEAKGIETVRRDCCPAAAKMLEMALKIQFTTRDVEQVKRYVQHQFVKIMSGKLSNIQDFIFARQYKPRDLDKKESVFVPAWQITKRLLRTDPRAEPRFKERVPFVIIYGEPRTPLVNLAKTPIEVLENLSYRINADYYIQKIICPTLNRIFCTLGVDTSLWYKTIPHGTILHRSHYLMAQKNLRGFGSFSSTAVSSSNQQHQSTMSQFFSPSHCPICAKSIPMTDDICEECYKDPATKQASIIRLMEEITKNQRKLFASHQLCIACSSLERDDGDNPANELYNPCISYDCPNLFRYHQAKLDALNSNYLNQVLKSLY